ncbi:MAG: AarF/ABC1/UbiB kinase family protein, partial [Myxococcota bacterium]
MADERRVPTGRFSRLARLATTGVRAGAHVLLDRGQDAGAKQAAETLGNMRALAAKLGQMLAYVDGVLPEHTRDAYEKGLKSLLDDTTTSSIAEISAVIEADLGAQPRELFATFSDEPFASASIGQVHRATLHDGREVAVKVQHPGVAEALEQDLSNAKLLEQVMAVMGARKFDSDRMLEELRQRFREELDYTLEGERQALFADIHAGDPQVLVPEVVQERTSRRVLTTEFARGMSFDDASAHPDEALRAEWCAAMWRFVYKSMFQGVFNADPHPGNYKFMDDGRVIFLDFGCVQTIDAERVARAKAVHLAAQSGDDDAFEAATRRLMNLEGGQWEELVLDYMRECFRPWFRSPFRITRPFSQTLFKRLKDMTLH